MELLKVPDYFNLRNYIVRLMLYSLFGIIVADGIITQFLVTDGQVMEANPFLQAWVGQDMFLAIKVSGAFLACLFLWTKYNEKPKLIFASTAIFLTFYTGIVFWNLFVFLTV
ncbi:MAG: DUF5658 family protein [Dehalococcoidales bacterium]|nr:DUF5658 family protein [Dehalococcoidales bacterium]